MTKLSKRQYNEHNDNKLKLTFAYIMEHVGKRIRQFRVIKGLTQQALADLIHKGRPLISHIENTGQVNHETLLTICKALQVNPEQLTSISEEGLTSWGSDEIKSLKSELDKLKNELRLKDEIITLQKAHIKELTKSSKPGK